MMRKWRRREKGHDRGLKLGATMVLRHVKVVRRRSGVGPSVWL